MMPVEAEDPQVVSRLRQFSLFRYFGITMMISVDVFLHTDEQLRKHSAGRRAGW
jgi:hypothetical protein